MAATRLIDALKSSTPKQNKTDEALQKIAEIFLNRAKTIIDPEANALPARVATDSTSNPCKEPLLRVEKGTTTQHKEPDKNIILETLREKRLRIRIENKLIAQSLSPDHVPACATSYQLPLCIDKIPHLPHLIEPDDYFINNGMPEESINATLQDSGELLEHRQLIKGPDAST